MRPEKESVLGRILASKEAELKQVVSLGYREELRARCRDLPEPKDFVQALKDAPPCGGNRRDQKALAQPG